MWVVKDQILVRSVTSRTDSLRGINKIDNGKKQPMNFELAQSFLGIRWKLDEEECGKVSGSSVRAYAHPDTFCTTPKAQVVMI